MHTPSLRQPSPEGIRTNRKTVHGSRLFRWCFAQVDGRNEPIGECWTKRQRWTMDSFLHVQPTTYNVQRVFSLMDEASVLDEAERWTMDGFLSLAKP
jgi:hypothetical protein